MYAVIEGYRSSGPGRPLISLIKAADLVYPKEANGRRKLIISLEDSTVTSSNIYGEEREMAIYHSSSIII